MKKSRAICLIAKDIQNDWKNLSVHAKPYLSAMKKLTSINDYYGCDEASSIIAYFLSNASGWRGNRARIIKKELKDMLERNRNNNLNDWS